MKFNFKSMVTGGIIGVVLMATIPASAYDGTRTIQAVYKNIRICIDGVEMTPRDAAGKEVEPFIYNGTTYLPIRAVGEAVGKQVSYDGSTNTVYLGKSGQVQYLGQQIESYRLERASEGTFTMAGQEYYNSVSSRHMAGTAYYNLNGLYTSMSGVYGMLDGTNADEGTILVYGDDRLLETLDVQVGMIPKNFAINVTGVNQLRIEFTKWDCCLGSVELR